MGLKSLYHGTLKPMLQGTEEHDARDVQNAWLWAKVGQFLASEKIDWTAFRAPALQILDNERIAREERDRQQGSYLEALERGRALSPEEYQKKLFDREWAAGIGEDGRYLGQGGLFNRVERRDRTGIDFLTNQPTYTKSIEPIKPGRLVTLFPPYFFEPDALGPDAERPMKHIDSKLLNTTPAPLPGNIVAIIEQFLKEQERE